MKSLGYILFFPFHSFIAIYLFIKNKFIFIIYLVEIVVLESLRVHYHLKDNWTMSDTGVCTFLVLNKYYKEPLITSQI